MNISVCWSKVFAREIWYVLGNVDVYWRTLVFARKRLVFTNVVYW